MGRQVSGLERSLAKSQTSDPPEMNMLSTWAADHLPSDPARPSLVHGTLSWTT